MIKFEDLTWIFYIWIPNTTIEGTMKEIQIKQHFATTFRRFTKKFMVSVYGTTFPYTTFSLSVTYYTCDSKDHK